MALINNLWVHVTDESVSRDVNSTSHPVEKGLPITDTIQINPITISLSGEIVNVGERKASDILNKLVQLKKEGSLITYKGRNTATNMQIQSLQTSHPYNIWGGCSFSMELKEVRIAKKAYTGIVTTGAKTSGTGEIKVGSIVVFKGGNVYVSSDAKKAAATRGRSTCKVTKIVSYSWSIHRYHLISTDGGKVYGWVDLENIECTNKAATTNPTANGGVQQVQKSNTELVYHKVKKGDMLIILIDKYKKDGVMQKDGSKLTEKYVKNNNKYAFKKNDNGTLTNLLIVGQVIFIGYRNK